MVPYQLAGLHLHACNLLWMHCCDACGVAAVLPACRKMHEEGDFGEAILLCMDCFQAVDTLGGFTVSSRCCAWWQQAYRLQIGIRHVEL
jgi:hypothetical protein